jgi:8-oxo-dGTP pyrophosphatase MutT (NUDIX family)
MTTGARSDYPLDRIIGTLSSDMPLPGDEARASMVPGYRRDGAAGTATEPWKDAAVLILLYAAGDTILFPIMLRPNGEGVHAGQVSLPGGAREGSESLEACALRETHEELGVDPAHVHVMRALSPLHVPPSRFAVYPFVGVTDERPDFSPSVSEVAGLFEASLQELLDPASVREDTMNRDGRDWLVPYYLLAGQRVWGATAMILAELQAILSKAMA